MSFYVIVDVVVHFLSFRNIDLYHQGLYCLRARVYQDRRILLKDSLITGAAIDGNCPEPISSEVSPNARTLTTAATLSTTTVPSTIASANAVPQAAVSINSASTAETCFSAYPYMLLPLRPSAATAPYLFPSGFEGRGLGPARTVTARRPSTTASKTPAVNCVFLPLIQDDTHSFYSRTFALRYCDEEVNLNDGCVFRIELDLCTPAILSAPFYLEVDLLVADLTTLNTLESSNSVPAGVGTSSHESSESPPSSDGVTARNNRPDKSQSDSAPTTHFQSATNSSDSSATALPTECVHSKDLFASRLRASAVVSARLTDDATAEPGVDRRRPHSRKAHFRASSKDLSAYLAAFSSVSHQVFQLNMPCKGLFEYIPVVFDEFHFSVCSLTVSTALLDVRARIQPNVFKVPYKPRYMMIKPGAQQQASPPRATVSALDEQYAAAENSAMSADLRLQFHPWRTFSDFLDLGILGAAPSPSVLNGASLITKTKLSPTAPQKNAVLLAVSASTDGSVTTPAGRRVACLAGEADDDPLSRAEQLHELYLRILLESFVRIASGFRFIAFRSLSTRQRLSLAPSLDIRPLELPGGNRIYLPGAVDAKPLAGGNASSSVVPEKSEVESTEEQNGSGAPTDSSAYVDSSTNILPTDDNSLEVSMILSVDALEDEIVRFCEETELELLSMGGPASPGHAPEHGASVASSFFQGNGASIQQPTQRQKAIEIRATIPKLRSRLESTEPSTLAALITQDYQLVSGQIMELWQRFLTTLPLVGSEYEATLQALYERKMIRKWREAIIQETIVTVDPSRPRTRNQCEAHQRTAETLRKSSTFLFQEPLSAVEMSLVPSPEFQPIIFEQRYFSTAKSLPPEHESLNFVTGPKGYQGIHLMVLVHGFQGSSYDMRLFKNCITLSFPSAMFLCSTANEDNTSGDINGMAQKLAQEVSTFVDECCPFEVLARVSFICHSLGGIIARAALPRLPRLFPKLHAFISLSSPHLGYMFNSNKLVEAGLWVLKKWKKSVALQQLTLSDSKAVQGCFLYQLSQKSEPLKFFRHICLFSSFQDQYVPYDSARIEISPKAEADTKFGPAYAEMVHNIMKYISPEQLCRFDVQFKLSERSLDSFIGRAAHIRFLECNILMRMVVQCYPTLFK